ncbi:MAG TPA: hypothetical protein VE913_12610 [Longimicrobium sp.]|nr:hypothetical protein [Longimicrobium sp.]
MSRLMELRGVAWAAGLIVALGACNGDALTTPPGDRTERVAVVLNSGSRTLTVVPVTEADPRPRSVSLGAMGTPTTLAVRGERAVVPMGTYAAALVVDLNLGTVLHTVPLPAGSGATGVAFLNDSVAVVANPGLNSVTPVNVLRGTAGAQVRVGPFPHVVRMIRARLFVLGGTQSSLVPSAPGSMWVLDAQLRVTVGVLMPGVEPRDIVPRGDRFLVLGAASPGGAGTVALHDTTTLIRTDLLLGFGTLPSSMAVDARGDLWVGVPGTGILLYSVGSRSFARPLDNPVRPENLSGVSRVTTDPAGLVYALYPGACTEPGVLMRLSPLGEVAGRAGTGVCPVDVGFTDLSRE